jgi:hypothetical protein
VQPVAARTRSHARRPAPKREAEPAPAPRERKRVRFADEAPDRGQREGPGARRDAPHDPVLEADVRGIVDGAGDSARDVARKFLALAEMTTVHARVPALLGELCAADPGLVVRLFGSFPPHIENYHSVINMLIDMANVPESVGRLARQLFEQSAARFPAKPAAPPAKRAAAPAKPAAAPAKRAAAPAKPAAAPAKQAVAPAKPAAAPVPDFEPKGALEHDVFRIIYTDVNNVHQLATKFLKLAELAGRRDGVKRALTAMCERDNRVYAYLFGSKAPTKKANYDAMVTALGPRSCKRKTCPLALELFRHVADTFSG